MKHHSTHKLNAVLVGLFLGFMAGTPVIADDTEIFTGTAASANTRPNVLFILDTSSSMNTFDTDPDTGLPYADNRLDRMKTALKAILDSVTDVNVGLMRFSGNDGGGPILYPISYVDANNCDIEDCSIAGSSVSVRVSQSSDDAEEDSGSGAVDLTSTSLDMVTEGGAGSTGCSATTPGTLYENNTFVNDTEEQGATSPMGHHALYDSSGDLELMYDASRGVQEMVGIRFQNVAVPKNATINCAEIVFEVDEPGAGTVSLDIFGDDTNDSDAWATSPANRLPSGRTQTSAKVDWEVTDNPAVGATLTTPDLSSIVQEIVYRGGWASGNDMAFMIALDADSGSAVSDASNTRIVSSYNGTTSPKLRVYYDTSSTVTPTSTNTVGLRFQDVQIPQGVTIISAALEFEVEASSADTTNLTIQGELADDASTFTTTTNDITSRSLTTASVAWSAIEGWSTSDDHHTSPDIKTIVQEIVNRGGWCGGQSMAMIISGVGERAATSFDSSSGDAPVLRITYDPTTIPSGGGCINTTYTKTVNASGNDAEESKTDNSVSTGSSDLDIMVDGSDEELIGLRFTGLDIAQGATILAASLQFEVNTVGSGSIDVTIKGQGSDDAVEFSASNSNISSRPTTSASVAWSISSADNPAAGEKINSPDVTSIVQEIVNRGGWSNGNDLAFILEKSSGSGSRTFESYDGKASAAARLSVQVQWNSGTSRL